MTSQPAAPFGGSVDRSKDPIWSTPVTEALHEEVGSRTSTVNSPRCGGWYSIHDSIAAKIKDWSGREKARLTSWLIKERQSRTECPKVTEDVIKHVKEQRDMPPPERADAILRYLKSKTHKLGEFRSQMKTKYITIYSLILNPPNLLLVMSLNIY